MRFFISAAIAALMLLGSHPSAANAATAKKPAPKRPAVKPPAPKPDPVETLIRAIAANSYEEGQNLWDRCLSSNIKALAFGLEDVQDKVTLVKSEYEKQSEFDERRAKMDAVLNPFGKIIVCQSVNDNDDAPFNYNAETESFTGSFKFRLLADLDFKKTGSYQSKTRMGVHASVESFVDFSYIVDSSAAFDDRKVPCAKVNYNSVSYSVPINRQSAPSLKNDGYLVLVGSIISPYVSISESEGNPTLDHPKDIYERIYSISFRPNYFGIVKQDGTMAFRCDL